MKLHPEVPKICLVSTLAVEYKKHSYSNSISANVREAPGDVACNPAP